MVHKLRIGQIGIAHTHATKLVVPPSKTLLDDLDVELVGIHEPDPALWDERHDRDVWDGVCWLDTAEELLDDPTIEAVHIETWPWDCVDWGRRVLESGKHVHIDKPPGNSVPELNALYDIAASKGLFIQMGYQWRFNPGLRFIQDTVKSGLIGRVTFARFRAGSTPEYYHRNYVHRFPGGIMREESCHLFDQVAWMFGKPDRITSFLHSDARGFDRMDEGVDNGLVVFEYDKQGAIAVIEATSTETNPSPHRRVEVHGTGGSIILEPIEPPKVNLCLREASGNYEADWQQIGLEDRPRYLGDIEELIGVVRGQREPLFSPEHDLLVQEMLVKACGGEA